MANGLVFIVIAELPQRQCTAVAELGSMCTFVESQCTKFIAMVPGEAPLASMIWNKINTGDPARDTETNKQQVLLESTYGAQRESKIRLRSLLAHQPRLHPLRMILTKNVTLGGLRE
jgi:hypothetical protein